MILQILNVVSGIRPQSDCACKGVIHRVESKLSIGSLCILYVQVKSNSAPSGGLSGEYCGLVSQAVKAISNVTNGGQVLMDLSTMTGLAREREAIHNEFAPPAPHAEKRKR